MLHGGETTRRQPGNQLHTDWRVSAVTVSTDAVKYSMRAADDGELARGGLADKVKTELKSK